ncbi:dachshund c isoform X2 [Hemibagrus wyckioides]|uniref:dachshund c isoform X2 n=1 Tax=Hemibagrus wyckioides TaxID=337641 RepID=UPI00266C0E80|nr:dachshund c isoform X2 [Hemibagrus wyckioides]
MATSVPLLPSAPLAHHAPPPISISASAGGGSSSPASLSPSPSSLAPSAASSLFRSDLLPSASPALPVGSAPHKPAYATPSPVESTPRNNECRLVEVRGARLASFSVDGRELICLPQAFDLFLKHLVGGLHTVYTKLKRLEITPVVCNVEQVRVLRGLGAIQPGVNRCKLISRRDFEVLYNDCTNAGSRPGRPPKRTQSVTSPESPHILPHSVSGLMSSGIMSHTGLTAATLAEAMKKKIKLEVLNSYHATNNHGADPENGDLNSGMGLELPFMMMSHPLIPVSLPPASVTMAMNQMNHLSTIASMAATAQAQNDSSRVATSVIKERVRDSPSPSPSLEDGRRSGSHASSRQSSSVSSSPAHTESSSDRPCTSVHTFQTTLKASLLQTFLAKCMKAVHQNGLSLGHALLGLSPNAPPGPKEGDLATQDAGHDSRRTHAEKEDSVLCTPTSRETYERVSHTIPTLPPGFPAPLLFPEGLSSIETLLTNIQGLLKVAIDNARAQEKQVQLEKTELKMELYRERELRETLERQLCVEQKNRALIQKRLKKEKKTKRKLQEALEYESKRRDQAEQTLQQTTASEHSHTPNEPPAPEMESDLSRDRTDADRTIPDGRLFLKTAVMF